MYTSEVAFLSGLLGVSSEVVVAGVVALALWSIMWKGIALWVSARGSQKGWFVALLVINTAGILEIIYLLFFKKRSSGA